MMTRYVIDIHKLIRDWTPSALKSDKPHTFWLRALMFPIKSWYHSIFEPFVATIRFKMSINSSVCRIEYMLNKIFYPPGLTVAYNRRIKIERVVYREPGYLYLGDGGDPASPGGIDGQPVEENGEIPTFLDSENQPRFLYTAAELGMAGGYDFIVKVPQPETGTFDAARMQAMINANKLPDRDYQIIQY